MVLAAVLLAVSSVLPWVTFTPVTGMPFDQNAFQFGPGQGLTAFGPVLAGSAVLLALLSIVVYQRRPRPNLCMALIPTLAAGLIVVQSWHGGFGPRSHVGPASYVAYVGLACGLAASLLMLPAERPRTS